MTDHLEDLIVKEANLRGIQPNAEAMRKAATDLAGANLTAQGLINLPNVGTISPADYIRSLRDSMPESFTSLDDKPAIESSGNLTADMRQEIEAGRRKRALPSDWVAVRSKTTGITAQHMAERERNWK